MTEMQFTSLMDLASIDTSDLSAKVSRLQREGIYVLELKELKFTEQPASDPAKPSNYNLVIRSGILAFSALKPEEGGNPEDMVGRDMTERYFLYGENMREAIELLMGRFKKVGFRHKGLMGGVEGSEPGWIEEAIGKRIAIRVRHYTPANGEERAGIDWLSVKQMEKAELPWEIMQRDFLDENGNVVDVAA